MIPHRVQYADGRIAGRARNDGGGRARNDVHWCGQRVAGQARNDGGGRARNDGLGRARKGGIGPSKRQKHPAPAVPNIGKAGTGRFVKESVS